MSKLTGYIVLGILSICYGSAYAFVSKALKYYEGSVLNSMRMWFAFFGAMVIFFCNYCFISGFKVSLTRYKTPALACMFCGILNYGLPHSLISIAQSTVPSTIVIIAQPFVSMLNLLFSSVMIPDEKLTVMKFCIQCIAITGAIITSIPNFSNIDFSSGGFNLFHYVLLICALISFSFGGIFIKKYLQNCNPVLMAVYQLLGSSIYATLFSVYRNSFVGYITSIAAPQLSAIFYPILLGVGFTCSATFMSTYCIKKLGVTITGFSNYGQIVVGIIVGVFFMGEWDNYSGKDYFIAIVGVIILIVSMVCGLLIKEKSKVDDQENLLTGE